MASAIPCVPSAATTSPPPAANCAPASRNSAHSRHKKRTACDRQQEHCCRSHAVRCRKRLTLFWLFVHSAQAAVADIDRAQRAVDLQAAAMHVQHEAAARAALREAHIIAMHRLALADFTTT